MTRQARIAGWLAAGLSLAWFLVHTFVGGAEVAGPLRASDLPVEVVAPAWMVWHMVTGLLLLMAVSFAVATLQRDAGSMILSSAMAAVFALAGLAAVPLTGAGLGDLPQGLLFVPVAIAGLIAWSGSRAR
ncbi:MAG: hypothetical protein HLUCCA08_09655 [Rhodobacteraceae bacterium HLUCCA08]|nr:MAG: hypothetical protein HLUCCA08_09655 [Rhodobacteraceae bacterium HLUCCA08]